jgi:hypothetical protein
MTSLLTREVQFITFLDFYILLRLSLSLPCTFSHSTFDSQITEMPSYAQRARGVPSDFVLSFTVRDHILQNTWRERRKMAADMQQTLPSRAGCVLL